MNREPIFVAALLGALLPALPAQEDGAQPMPQKEHELLRQMVGTWQCSGTTAAMPGVPGMEEPAKAEAIEHGEMICNGTWLKWTSTGTCQGKVIHGLWLAGYDPYQKCYVAIWADSEHSLVPGSMVGRYDAEKKTWTWTGKSAHGEFRSVCVIEGPDAQTETNYAIGPNGEEQKVMEARRTRVKSPAPAVKAPAAAARGDDVGPELALLHGSVGEWKAAFAMTMDPSQPPLKDEASEVVTPICDGKLVWTDYKGSMMGQPFEGHALTGYDAETKDYVSYWIDAMSPGFMRTSGKYDAKTKTCTMEGTCAGEGGAPMRVTQVLTWKEDGSRTMNMRFTGAGGSSAIDIVYTRKGKG